MGLAVKKIGEYEIFDGGTRLKALKILKIDKA